MNGTERKSLAQRGFAYLFNVSNEQTKEPIMRNVEVKDIETLEFSFKMDKSSTEELKAKVVVDLSQLTGEQILEWAFSAMVVSYQSKLRGKNPPAVGEDGAYKWSVPARGTRLVADPAKQQEKALGVLGKMDAETKYYAFLKIGME